MTSSQEPNSTFVALAPSPRLKETTSEASKELIDLRVKYLVPGSVSRAAARVTQLKKMFVSGPQTVIAAQDAAARQSVRRLRLAKSVRNIQVEAAAGTSKNAGGTLCLPFFSCAALPLLDQATEPCSGVPSSLVVTGSVDGLLTLWDAASCRPLASCSTYADYQWGRVRSIAAMPSSSAASSCVFFSASMFQRAIQAWHVRPAQTDAGTELEMAPLTQPAAEKDTPPAIHHAGTINHLAVDPSGALLASASSDSTVGLWDVRRLVDGGAAASPLLTSLGALDGYETAGAVLGLAYHPDGSLLSTSDAGGRVVTWDLRNGKVAMCTAGAGATTGGHLSAAPCVAWSPCGVRFASGGADSVIQLWDARRLSRASSNAPASPCRLFGHEDAVTSLSFYTDPAQHPALGGGTMPIALLSTSLDHTMRVWDMNTGLPVRVLDAGTPLYGHCRPSLPSPLPGVAAPSAIMAVGHSKQWMLYDASTVVSLLDGEVEEEEGGVVEMMQTSLVAKAGRGGGGQMTMEVRTEEASVVAVDAGEEDSSDDEEDEMAALRSQKPTATNEESDSDDDDDEMEALKKKK